MNPRPILALVGIIAAMAAIAAFAYAQPFWGDDVPSSEATPSVVGICNVSIDNVPAGVSASALSYPVPDGQENTPVPGTGLFLLVWIPSDPGEPISTTDPLTGQALDPRSRVAIDAADGAIVFESYRNAAEEALIAETLKGLSVGDWQPQRDAWPKTDTVPRTELVGRPYPPDADVKYREPEVGSGMIAGEIHGDTFSRIRAFTCESVVEVNGVTGQITKEDVSASERQMFDRFIGEVRLASRKGDPS